MATAAKSDTVRVGTLEELEARGVIVVQAADRPVAVFAHEGKVSAVDNRCPHMGFPLHRGTVKDGILTCHWHEARFDLCGGCTFDLWADDVPAYDTEVRDGVVFVSAWPRRHEDRDHYLRRLRHGLEHDIGLIQAKGILGLQKTGAAGQEIAREVALYGARHQDDWGQGMTILAVVANLMPYLGPETAYFALLRASRQVAADCSGAAPHRPLVPLTGRHAAGRLAGWMREWVRGRHRDGAERVLLTALEAFGPSPELADIIFTAANDRVFAQTGHVFDFANKAFELLDAIGWDHAAELLPLVMGQMASARGAEEDVHWHHPTEVIRPLREAEEQLPALLREGVGKTWEAGPGLTDVLLGDDPLAILAALTGALRAGAAPAELARRVAYAAALRLARFPMTNEVGDWFGPRHTFIFANAVHQAVKRCPAPGVVRGVFHAALAVYMDRFLNVPPAKLPEETSDLPEGARELREHLLQLLNTQAQVGPAAETVVRCVRLGHPVRDLIDTLTLATVREDFDFHAIQVLEAGVRQYHEWQGGPEGEHILAGVARQLAAFCPTPRAGHQTSHIALRLQRGDRMYEEEG